MKKMICLLVVMACFSAYLQGQDYYIRIGIGPALGLKSGYSSDYTYNSSTDYTADYKARRLGNSMNFNLAFGRVLSDYLKVELAINGQAGFSASSTYKSVSGESNTSLTVISKQGCNMLQLIPALTFSAGRQKVNPYARIGFIIGVLPGVVDQTTRTQEDSYYGSSTTETKSRISGGITLGFNAAGGAEFNFTEKFGMFAELVFNGISYSPTKGKYTVYTIDGVDQLGDMTTDEKEWTYEKSIGSSTETGSDSPEKRPKTAYQVSNMGLNLGLLFKF